MRIIEVIWLPEVVDKLQWKHNVRTTEVEELFGHRPRYRRIEEGNVAGEDLYAALGRTDAGRLLVVFFIDKAPGKALVISGRDMTRKERRAYGRK